ncbi:response regulator transcription factor [Paludibacterium yongneupense]|uniref:response regulator transcription factor n=1 Tax=Paludibacterium yongneupense TaxID=400061 RepID=UPI00048DC5A3|nr:response regulator transcription factor [Paludibacterium yongneupense]
MKSTPRSVLIADDTPLIRQGLRRVLRGREDDDIVKPFNAGAVQNALDRCLPAAGHRPHSKPGTP